MAVPLARRPLLPVSSSSPLHRAAPARVLPAHPSSSSLFHPVATSPTTPGSPPLPRFVPCLAAAAIPSSQEGQAQRPYQSTGVRGSPPPPQAGTGRAALFRPVFSPPPPSDRRWVKSCTERAEIDTSVECGGSVCFWPLDPDSDPLIRGPDPDPSIIKQNCKKNLDCCCFFVTPLCLFVFEIWCKCCFKKYRNKQKIFE